MALWDYVVQELVRTLRLTKSNILGTHGAIPMEDKTRWNKPHQHRKDLVIKSFSSRKIKIKMGYMFSWNLTG